MPVEAFGCPKPARKKRQRHHAASILQKKDGTCYLCKELCGSGRIYRQVEEHHIFFGSGQRWKSEEDGLKVYLCAEHHRTGPEAVHRNAAICRRVQAAGQRAYEETHSREAFMERYGRNYIYQEGGT